MLTSQGCEFSLWVVHVKVGLGVPRGSRPTKSILCFLSEEEQNVRRDCEAAGGIWVNCTQVQNVTRP